MKYENGEYISLSWGYDTPELWAVWGHVTPPEFRREISEHWPTIEVIDEHRIKHHYGLWTVQGPWDGTRYLKTYSEPGRGRFKITVVYCE